MNRSARIGRAAARTGAVTAVSRVAGLGRVLVISAVLGTTYLGNTFQSSNSVSNVVFDLLAAGGLSAVLVPALVRSANNRDDTERLANGALGIATIVLAALGIIGMIAAPLIGRVLASGAPNAVATQQRELATFLVRWFVPQIVLYGFGAVATAVLHSRRRFATAAAAPIANTVVMVACFAAFRAHAGAHPGFALDGTSKLLLATAGTGGVLAFVLTLTIPVWRSGIRLRPQVRRNDAGVRALLAHSVWGILLNSIAGLLAAATVIAGNAVQGGVVAFQVAFVLFLAPYAILSQPLASASLPEFTDDANSTDRRVLGHTLHWTLESMCALMAPAAAILVVFARPGLLALGLGLGHRGDLLVASGLAGLALGLVPYSAFLVIARAMYALDDSRTPALVSLLCGAVGVLCITLARLTWHEQGLIGALGVAHSFAYAIGAVVLGMYLRHRTGNSVVTRRATVPIGVAFALGIPAWLVVRSLDSAGQPLSRVGSLLLCGIGVAIYIALYTGLLQHNGFRRDGDHIQGEPEASDRESSR